MQAKQTENSTNPVAAAPTPTPAPTSTVTAGTTGLSPAPEKQHHRLPLIPAKRYFTIGEVSELCGVKPHVLRYWEQEFTQLKPLKRRGNRRYYQHHEVLLVRRIRELLYEEGFTISGARNRLTEGAIAVHEDQLEADQLRAALRKLRAELREVVEELRS